MKKIFLVIFTIIFSVIGLNFVQAYSLADPQDIFYVNTPGANQKVSGVINITWRMYDDDQAIIPYTAKLYDAATCESVNYGSINSNMNGSSNPNQDNSLAWNTNNTQTSTNLPDGNYCLQICVAMKNSGANYSACNARIVKIVNHNSLPVISSNPSNLTIRESQSWSYQVTAYDPDNDPLTYSLIYSTNFLQINSQTGLITTNGNSKALPAGVNQVNYTIRVGVNDGISGVRTQEFTLTIIKDSASVNPPPPVVTPPSNPPTDEEDDDEVNTPSVIDINYPSDNSILKGANNLIQWDISDAEGVSKIKLEYSKEDSDEWVEINTLDSESDINAGGLTWDVSNIEDGEYKLRINVTDSEGLEVSRVTDSFLIDNIDEGTQSQPLIINITPESDSEINENILLISGEFIPSTDASVIVESVKVILNDVDITEQCSITQGRFNCNITQALEDGKHSVNVTYNDTSEKVAGLNWTFTVNTKPEDQVLEQDMVIILGREIPRNSLIILFGIIVIFAILLVIPWVLYRNWKKNQKNGEGDLFTPSGSYDTFKPIETPNLYSDQTKFDTSEPAVKSFPESPAQSEIEKNLNEYWAGQGEQPVSTSSYTSEQPSYPEPVGENNSLQKLETDQNKPFQEVTPNAPESLTPQPQQPTAEPLNQKSTESNTTKAPEEENRESDFFEPTPIDPNK